MGKGRVKGGELGEASLIESKWEEKEHGRVGGERKGEGEKKSMRNRIGGGVSKRRKDSIQELRRL